MPTALIHEPMCGHCETAWDLVYRRIRSDTSIGQWLSYCRVGGCDPDIWDFVNEDGGQTTDRPAYVPSLFHRRDRSAPATWTFNKKNGHKKRMAHDADEERVRYTPEEMLQREANEVMRRKTQADEVEWADDLEDLEDVDWG